MLHRCLPFPRQQAGSGLVTVATAAGARSAATIISSNAMETERRMRIARL